ncbi:class II peroxidase [Patellaria atrata CBS 101060]|uniref:Peroxidase n=1 Tax=Patellaria atrata CBS 101060 TaxID=1346257 RepID=A0A9P4VV49_9PEZI|nr:class II peroxidase [Patellaria atrata CBS 101060]
MKVSFVCLVAATATVQGFQLPDLSNWTRDLKVPSLEDLKRRVLPESLRPRATCPAVWSDVSKDLIALFKVTGACNADARHAIRAAFHDCFNNGCDGSIYLAQEYNRPENVGTPDVVKKLGTLATFRRVGVADMIQFANAVAIATCPSGPRIPAYVGRKDSSVAATEGQLPSPFASGDTLVAQFKAKGFTPTEFAALLGAHTVSEQLHVDSSKVGATQDDTPGQWDNKYFQQTIDGSAPFRFQSDINVANHAETSSKFRSYASSQAAWNRDFIPAVTKMSVLGVSGGVGALTDCSQYIPAVSAKRDIRNAPINNRAV